MVLKRFMASQLRKPSGWFGTLVMGRLMNRVNRKHIEATLGLLALYPHHQVLEIGFGGGAALSRLADTLSSGTITGVDTSTDLVRQAERQFRRRIEEGRVRVQSANVVQLPFPDSAFDRVFTVNTIYFWPDVLQGLGEIRRVLKDGGLAAVGLRSGHKMKDYAVTKYGFRLFEAQEAADLMRRAGFREVQVDHRDQEKWYDQIVVLGKR